MIDTTELVSSVVSTLQSIPALVAIMNGDPAQIAAFHYYYGVENALEQTLFEMKAPSILVAWEGTEPGNFDATAMWKYHIAVYMKTANQATAVSPVSYERLWYVICNAPVNGTNQNIRYSIILKDGNGSPLVDIMDTPPVTHLQDQNGMDYFKGLFVFPDLSEQNPQNSWIG